MTRFLKTGAIAVLAVISLTACQTTGKGYKQALSDPQMNHVEAKEEKLPAIPVGSGEIDKYEVASLKPLQRPAIESEEAGLWYVVEKQEDRIATSSNLYESKELVSYLKDVTCRVAAQYCQDIRLYVVQNPLFNASMMPNGVMQINTGLLLRVDNEAQLAAIIGHEIGHYLRRHSWQRMLDVRQKAGMAVVAQLAMIAVGVPELGAVGNMLAYGSIMSYSRNLEREADGYGLVLMQAAGYDPMEASEVWANLLREKEASKKGSGSLFYSTHPPSEERMNVLNTMARELAKKSDIELTAAEQSYRQAVGSHLPRFVSDELLLRSFDTSKELFTILLERGNNDSLMQFAMGELHRTRNDEDDANKALEFFEKSEKSGTPPVELHRSRGLVLWKTGDKQKAKTSLSQYLAAAPDASDNSMIKMMIGEKE